MLLAALLLAAAALRLVLFFLTLDDPYLQFRQGDEAYYHEWALRILGGEWARGKAFFTTPLYAYFLALAYAVGGQGLVYLRLLNLALGLGTVGLTWLAARHFVGPRWALAAAAFPAFSAAAVSYEWFPEKTSLVLFLIALACWLVARAADGDRAGPWLAGGLAIGVGALAHTLLLALAPAAALHLLLGRGPPRRSRLRALGCLAAGVTLGVFPATLHNLLQEGSPVLVASHGGVTFYLGNGAGNLTGRYVSPPFSVSDARNEEADFKAEAERRTGRSLTSAEVSRFWFRQGLAEMRLAPGLALRRIANRLRWAIGAGEETDTRTFEFYRERYPVLGFPLLSFGVPSVLGLLGLVLRGRDRRFFFPAAAVFLLAGGLSLVLVYGRYRLPLLVPLAILAAAALERIVALAAARRVLPLAAAGAAAGVLAWLVFTAVFPREPVSFLLDYNNQGNRYFDLKQYDRAAEEYEKALTVRPGDHPSVRRLSLGLARMYLGRGRFDRAEDLLRRAEAQFPGDPEFHRLREELSRRRGRAR